MYISLSLSLIVWVVSHFPSSLNIKQLHRYRSLTCAHYIITVTYTTLYRIIIYIRRIYNWIYLRDSVVIRNTHELFIPLFTPFTPVTLLIKKTFSFFSLSLTLPIFPFIFTVTFLIRHLKVKLDRRRPHHDPRTFQKRIPHQWLFSSSHHQRQIDLSILPRSVQLFLFDPLITWLKIKLNNKLNDGRQQYDSRCVLKWS